MAIKAGSHSLFSAHTPSGCPQQLHLPFKAFQGQGYLTQLHPLAPQGPDLSALAHLCALLELWKR